MKSLPNPTTTALAAAFTLAAAWLALAQTTPPAPPPVRLVPLVPVDPASDGRLTCHIDQQLPSARAVGHILLSAPLRSFENPADVVRVVSYSIIFIHPDQTCATVSNTCAVSRASVAPEEASFAVGNAQSAKGFKLHLEPAPGLTWGTAAKPEDLRIELTAQ